MRFNCGRGSHMVLRFFYGFLGFEIVCAILIGFLFLFARLQVCV